MDVKLPKVKFSRKAQQKPKKKGEKQEIQFSNNIQNVEFFSEPNNNINNNDNNNTNINNNNNNNNNTNNIHNNNIYKGDIQSFNPNNFPIQINDEKKCIHLMEWKPTDIALTKTERTQLTQLCLNSLGMTNSLSVTEKLASARDSKKKTQRLIQITLGDTEGVFQVIPRNVVGVIELEHKMLFIHPKFSVKNLMFLISYCWEPSHWDPHNIKAYQMSDSNNERSYPLTNSLCFAFLAHAEPLVRHGLLQTYCKRTETLQGFKGTVNWAQQVRKFPGRFYPLVCNFQEFSENILENQIFKSACSLLLNSRYVSAANSKRVRVIFRSLENVSLVKFDPKNLPEIRWSHTNVHYKTVIEISKFILQNFTWAFTQGTFSAPSFLLYMPRIFEDFIVKSLRASLPFQKLHANERNFPQNRTITYDLKGEVEMKPDFSFWDQDDICRFVGDVKYKRLVDRKSSTDLGAEDDDEDQLETRSANSNTPDIYQITTYGLTLGLGNAFLIYAADQKSQNTSTPVKYSDINAPNFRIYRRAVNLNAEPKAILLQIQALAEEMVQIIHQNVETYNKARKVERFATLFD